jgi:hypothetical protein
MSPNESNVFMVRLEVEIDSTSKGLFQATYFPP